MNQADLRAESDKKLSLGIELPEYQTGETKLGTRVVLPSSFPGGPRHMQQSYMDAMAIVRKFGKPDFFVTFTANRGWPEVTRNLPSGQKASDRPDLVARVFHLKL